MIALIGAGLLGVTVAALMVTGLASGRPSDFVWIGWLLGTFLLAVGPVWWGLALRRIRPRVGWPLVGAGVATFLSAAVGDVIWHDVALAAMAGCWALAGLRLARS